MDVMIIATKACTHRQNLEKELESLQIPYRVCFVEDRADLVEKFAIRHSSNLIVDGDILDHSRLRRRERGMPTEEPSVDVLLDVDHDYLDKAKAGRCWLEIG